MTTVFFYDRRKGTTSPGEKVSRSSPTLCKFTKRLRWEWGDDCLPTSSPMEDTEITLKADGSKGPKSRANGCNVIQEIRKMRHYLGGPNCPIVYNEPGTKITKPLRSCVGIPFLEDICCMVLDDERNIPEPWYWNCYEVHIWLEQLGLGQYSTLFRKNLINGRKLPLINLRWLQKMTVRKFDDAMLILNSIRKMFHMKAEKSFLDPLAENGWEATWAFWFKRWWQDEFRRSSTDPKPLAMMPFMYHEGYVAAHDHTFNPKHLSCTDLEECAQLPFVLGRNIPNSSARKLIIRHGLSVPEAGARNSARYVMPKCGTIPILNKLYKW